MFAPGTGRAFIENRILTADFRDMLLRFPGNRDKWPGIGTFVRSAVTLQVDARQDLR